MSILIDQNSRVVVQGITGREGTYHALRNRDYGTQVVAGVTPRKGGQDVSGIPVFDTVAQAVEATQANVSLVFVPARLAADAICEAVEAGIAVVVVITEGIPVNDMLELHHWVRQRDAVLIGPNGPGIISPGKASVGIMPTEVFTPGPIGLVSRSGTLTYEIADALTQTGLGQSTAVGIGGDAIPGSGFIDLLERFEADPETDAVVMVGEIGGGEEELAAAFVSKHMGKPVIAYIAGFTAPVGKQMGHAGAIISGSSGTAQAKKAALEAAGVPVASTPGEVPALVIGALEGRGLTMPRTLSEKASASITRKPTGTLAGR
jgi:succinyl-CoA synthetase alpha subunit